MVHLEEFSHVVILGLPRNLVYVKDCGAHVTSLTYATVAQAVVSLGDFDSQLIVHQQTESVIHSVREFPPATLTSSHVDQLHHSDACTAFHSQPLALACMILTCIWRFTMRPTHSEPTEM